MIPCHASGKCLLWTLTSRSMVYKAANIGNETTNRRRAAICARPLGIGLCAQGVYTVVTWPLVRCPNKITA